MVIYFDSLQFHFQNKYIFQFYLHTMSETPENPKDEIDQASEAQEKKVKAHSENLGQQGKLMFNEAYLFLKELLSIRSETDYKQTRAGIERDVTFRGQSVYILICSIFIASIGLNLNSTAVIIGAMLIAPLMGPILGVGLALGTNDFVLLFKSLKNFGVMIAISLITSTIYFWLTPLVEYQPELLARTKPTTLDIFVAIFGGIAGIVAGSRKEKSNVVSGVAIATALMPPLCTAGFGLATGNMIYFFGAFYLFMLNSIFICVATYVGVRYLRFPLRIFMNPKKEKQVKVGMLLFVLILIIPSLWIFWGVIKESIFSRNATKFVTEVGIVEGSKMVSQKLIYNDTVPVIELFMIGKEVPEDIVAEWRSKMPDYGLENSELHVYGSAKQDNSSTDESINMISGRLQSLRADILDDLYTKNEQIIENKDERIELLENRILEFQSREVKIESIGKELKIQFENIQKVAFANSIQTDFEGTIDTIPTFLIQWKKSSPSRLCRKQEQTISDLMKVRLELDTVRVIPFK